MHFAPSANGTTPTTTSWTSSLIITTIAKPLYFYYPLSLYIKRKWTSITYMSNASQIRYKKLRIDLSMPKSCKESSIITSSCGWPFKELELRILTRDLENSYHLLHQEHKNCPSFCHHRTLSPSLIQFPHILNLHLSHLLLSLYLYTNGLLNQALSMDATIILLLICLTELQMTHHALPHLTCHNYTYLALLLLPLLLHYPRLTLSFLTKPLL